MDERKGLFRQTEQSNVRLLLHLRGCSQTRASCCTCLVLFKLEASEDVSIKFVIVARYRLMRLERNTVGRPTCYRKVTR